MQNYKLPCIKNPDINSSACKTIENNNTGLKTTHVQSNINETKYKTGLKACSKICLKLPSLLPAMGGWFFLLQDI